MPRIEQVIFTSIESDCDAGYGVVARSPGVCEADARELAVWGPTHDSMRNLGAEAVSYNFHPLPSGAWCVSRSVPIGGERHAGGQRLHTQCLVVPPEVLDRFDNNPFSLVQAAAADGLWRADRGVSACETSFESDAADRPAGRAAPIFASAGHRPKVGRGMPPSSLQKAAGIVPALEPPPLVGAGAAVVDDALLASLAADLGVENLAALVQTARDAVCLALSCPVAPATLIAGLFSCLPPECRLELSFSTGLRFSPRRPFRIVALSGDAAERQWIANFHNVAVLDLRTGQSPPSMPLDGWTRFVRQALSHGHIPFLASQLAKRRRRLTPDDLPALGLQLLEEMEASNLPCENIARPELPERPSRCIARDGPAQSLARLDPNSPAVLEKLEHLDDLVYGAINGQAEAMSELEAAWPNLAAELGDAMLAESREQYLRYALSLWGECAQADNVRQCSRAIHALEVLCVLFGDAT